MTCWKAFHAQLRRDLAEWWPLWAASVALGLVPLLLPMIYSARGEAALDLRAAAATVGGGLFALASLALLGDGLAARDLGEGRLGFFLSRPMGARAFWLARVAAALVLMAAILLSLGLPAWIAEPPDVTSREPTVSPWVLSLTMPGLNLEDGWGPFRVETRTLGLLRGLAPFGHFGLLLALLLLAHLASTAGRSRDAWTLVDFGGLLLVVLLALATRDVLLSAHAFAALVAAERLFVLALAAVLLVAGARQVSQGRGDLARGHGAFSRTAWPLLVLASLALLGAARWVADPAPGELLSAERVLATSDGRQALVVGQVAHRLGMRTGVVFSVEGPEVIGPVLAAAVADRGGRFAWTRCRRLLRLDCEVWTRATEDRSFVFGTGIFVDRWDHDLAWSPHGELLALAQDRIEVWLPGGPSGEAAARLVYALDPGDGYPVLPSFPSARRLRFLFLEPDGDAMRLDEIDLESRSVRTLGVMQGESPLLVGTSPSGRYVLATSLIPSCTSLLDTETGEVREITSHPLLAGRALVSARFGGEGDLYLLTVGDGAWGLVRLGLDPDPSSAGDGEITLPPLTTNAEARLGFRDGRLLLSGKTGNGWRLWQLEPEGAGSEGAWHPLHDDVRILYRPARLAPQRDTDMLASSDGAVLRLGDDGLEEIVPALPETQAGRPLPF